MIKDWKFKLHNYQIYDEWTTNFFGLLILLLSILARTFFVLWKDGLWKFPKCKIKWARYPSRFSSWMMVGASPPEPFFWRLWGLLRLLCAGCLVGREIYGTVLTAREFPSYNYLVSRHYFTCIRCFFVVRRWESCCSVTINMCVSLCAKTRWESRRSVMMNLCFSLEMLACFSCLVLASNVLALQLQALFVIFVDVYAFQASTG